MDSQQGQDACAEGWRLLEAGRWDAARQAFETAMSAEPTPDARDGLGYALNYLGRTGEGLAKQGELTGREQEVLDLLMLGMSNAKIARTLFITDKTAGVSRILSKLGVSSRVEAVVHAARAKGVTTA